MNEPHDEAERLWEERYAGSSQVWSGEPNRPLVDLVAPLSPGRALDLGCGEGGDAVHLASRGWRVTAVDISPTALDRTRALAERAGVADRITTERHDLTRTFPDGAYDLVSSLFLHCHQESARDGLLRRAAGALTVGGLLFVVEHGSVPPWAPEPHPHHVRFSTPQEIHEGMALDPARYRPERLAVQERLATGPGGVTGPLTDVIVLVRRIA
ncbi:SAM-dependent methyltransferase [Thermomonospora catenispora]|uniref:SAM-dependent methyltransferase n=1 Tax=Thermomonospora catenispora TaxID=2493090 RepID=UPI00111F6A9B|nr:class I SAM-dependent methyltransferase [Thermomonospora catenispora]TNY38141.1 class I SAM-dependent methyltransferase [Thermomonospora catenispora]